MMMNQADSEESGTAADPLSEGDRERAFRILVRQAGLLAEWGAKTMGLEQDEAQRYAIELVGISIGKSEEAMTRRLARDLEKRGAAVDRDAFESKLEETRRRAAEGK